MTKGHLGNPEGQAEVESPQAEVIFDKFHLYQEKRFFLAKNEAVLRMLYLSEISPDDNFSKRVI